MTPTELTRTIARGVVERSTALGWKGKKQTDHAIDYICGAAMALHATDHEHVQAVTAMAFMVSVRGYSEVLRYAGD